jgi:hypothetical protein
MTDHKVQAIVPTILRLQQQSDYCSFLLYNELGLQSTKLSI